MPMLGHTFWVIKLVDKVMLAYEPSIATQWLAAGDSFTLDLANAFPFRTRKRARDHVRLLRKDFPAFRITVEKI